MSKYINIHLISRNMRRYFLHAFRYFIYKIRFIDQRISVDNSSWIAKKSLICSDKKGSIYIGKNCEIHPYTIISTYGGVISIGDNSSVNPFSILYGHSGLKIGKGVRIAAHVVFIPANHIKGVIKGQVFSSGHHGHGIVVDDDVWIGTGAKILDGVHIGRGSIIGAGSVVTRSVPPNTTVVGVPARIVKTSS